MSASGLIAALRERGLIAADAPAAPDEPDRPWFVSLLMGIAGWMAGLFVLVFLAILLDLDKRLQIAGTGVALLGVAWVLYAAGRGRVFVDQLALAFSIAGQLAISVYLMESIHAALPIAAAILGMQLLLLVVMPDRVARTLAATFASIAWVFVLRFAMRPDEGAGRLFDDRVHFTPLPFGEWTPAIEWLLTWAPLIFIVIALRRSETRWMARRAAAFARPALTGLLLGLALGGMAAEPLDQLALDTDEMGRAFNAWGLLPLLSVALAMTAAWNAFLLRSSGLLGFAIAAALVHLARFYYLYGTTLTIKAAIMLGVGLVLLGAGRLLARRVEVPA